MPESSNFDLRNFLTLLRERYTEQAKREAAQEICNLIDDIELSENGRSMEEWKEFKKIRNRIRDTYAI